MRDYIAEHKKEILQAVKELQAIPNFKPYRATGLRIDWKNGKTQKIKDIVNIRTQWINYTQIRVANALHCMMDTFTTTKRDMCRKWQEKYADDPKIVEALSVVERFIV